MDKKRAIKTAIVISLSVGILIWGLNFLKNKKIFNPDAKYYGVYQRIDGLTVSSAVLMNGFKIGQVSAIHFLPDSSGRLVVELQIDDQYKLTKSCVAEVFSVDIMGTKGVQINFDKTEKKYAQTGDTLATSIEGDLKEQVNQQILPLKVKAEELIGSFDSVLIAIKGVFDNKTRDNLSKSFNSVRITLKNLENTTFTMDTLLSTEKNVLTAILANTASITRNIENNNANITKAIKNISNITDTLAKADFISVISKTETVMTGFNEIVTKINAGEGTIGMLVHNDTLYQNLENTSYNMNRLMRDMRENPKRYVRFSAFDLGRTVNNYGDEEDKKKKGK